MKREVLKFHYEELVYVLMILTSDLKKYNDEDLKNFVEAIYRLDTFSTKKFLNQLKIINMGFNAETISKIIKLHKIMIPLYSKQWYKKLKNTNDNLDEVRNLANQILIDLNEDYIEPVKYAENKMIINW